MCVLLLVRARQLKLRATHGKTGLRRLEVQPPPKVFALSCPQFQLPGPNCFQSSPSLAGAGNFDKSPTHWASGGISTAP